MKLGKVLALPGLLLLCFGFSGAPPPLHAPIAESGSAAVVSGGSSYYSVTGSFTAYKNAQNVVTATGVTLYSSDQNGPVTFSIPTLTGTDNGSGTVTWNPSTATMTNCGGSSPCTITPPTCNAIWGV